MATGLEMRKIYVLKDLDIFPAIPHTDFTIQQRGVAGSAAAVHSVNTAFARNDLK